MQACDCCCTCSHTMRTRADHYVHWFVQAPAVCWILAVTGNVGDSTQNWGLQHWLAWRALACLKASPYPSMDFGWTPTRFGKQEKLLSILGLIGSLSFHILDWAHGRPAIVLMISLMPQRAGGVRVGGVVRVLQAHHQHWDSILGWIWNMKG